MKVFLALTSVLLSLATARPTCPKKPTPSTSAITSAYGSATTTPSTNATNATATPAAGGYSNSTSGTRLATGWYPGWGADKFSPSQIPWDKYSALTYAFAVTTPDDSFFKISDDPSVLTEFVSQAHAHNVKALVSIGGYTGSRYFSSSVSTPENRTAFATALMDFATKNQLDGLDFDWEYPNKQGMGCNVINDNDTANFLELLKEVRQKAPKDFQLTAAVAMTPFNGPDGKPMSDVSGFAQVLNHIAIMAYDVYGTWSETGAGPNAPIQDTCAPTQKQLGSCASAVKAWSDAGIPANQLVLGVPAYGRSYTVASSAVGGYAQKLSEYPTFDKNLVPLGTGETRTQTKDECGVEQGPGGIFNYNDMVARGFIDSQGNAGSGLTYQFDNCSQTAYIYNSTSQVLINYDTADTYKAKGNFIKEQNLAGFAMWSIDTDTADGTLAGAIRSTM